MMPRTFSLPLQSPGLQRRGICRGFYFDLGGQKRNQPVSRYNDAMPEFLLLVRQCSALPHQFVNDRKQYSDPVR